MIEVELFLAHRGTAFSDRDPNDTVSGWKFVGKRRIVDLPSVGDQIRIAPGHVVRVRGVLHLAEMDSEGEGHEPAVRLMVEVLLKDEIVGPID